MKRLLTIVFVLLAIPVMAQDGSGFSAKTNDALPEVLGVCGPIYQTLLALGPKTTDGQLDKEFIWAKEFVPGFARSLIPAPESIKALFADHPPKYVELQDFRGTVRGASLLWEVSGDDRKATWDALLDYLVTENGHPSDGDDFWKVWNDDSIHIDMSWTEYEDTMFVFYSCSSLAEEFSKARDIAEREGQDGPKTESSLNRVEPDTWTRESILSVVAQYGQPSEEFHEVGERVVGFHYGHLDMEGFPCELWFWFFEGREIYSAMKIPPVGGPSNAVSSFASMREISLEKHGLPDENILDDGGVRQRLIWRKGPQTHTVTFFEDDGHPWFLMETSDTEHLDKIKGELRPSSTLAATSG